MKKRAAFRAQTAADAAGDRERGNSVKQWQWLMMVIPVMAAGTVIYFLMKYRMNSRWQILAKCMVTWMAVCTAAAGLIQRQENPAGNLIFWAVLLFMAADGLLEAVFPAGAGVFAVGHILLIVWYVQNGGFHPEAAVLFAALCLGASVLFAREQRALFRQKKYFSVAGLYLYLAFLMAMVSMAVFLPVSAGKAGIPAAVGASAFAVSDMMVGKNVLTGLSKRGNEFALCLYYAAVLCISLAAWTEL